MLKKPAVLLLFLALSVSLVGCTGASKETTTIPNASTIQSFVMNFNPTQADKLIQANKSNSKFVILDVRTPAEYAEGHLLNAKNIDYESTNFNNEAGRIDKNMIYLVYCQTGVRSASAAKTMNELGIKAIYNLAGGITAWQSANLTVVK